MCLKTVKRYSMELACGLVASVSSPPVALAPRDDAHLSPQKLEGSDSEASDHVEGLSGRPTQHVQLSYLRAPAAILPEGSTSAGTL